MRKILFCVISILTLVMVGCAGNMQKNSARLVELDQAGQLMPGVPAIEGGCVAELGDNYEITELKFEGGNCVMKARSKGAEEAEVVEPTN